MVAHNTEYFLEETDDKTHCFYISFDLGDDGEIYQKIEASKKNECETCTDETALSEIEEPLNTEVQEEDEKKEEPKSTETALHVKEDVIENELKEDIKKDGI